MNSIKQLPPSWWKHSSSAWNDIEQFFLEYDHSDNIKEKESNAHFKKVHWHAISTGRSNHSYRFSGLRRKLFIQISNRSNAQFLPYEKVNSLNEIMPSSEYAKLSPWLVETFYQSKEVRIEKWFESESLDLNLNRNKNVIEKLAKSLAELHQAKTAKLPNFDLERHLKKYQKIALNKDKNKELTSSINSCVSDAILKLKSYQPGSLCHYDLNLHNILINRNEMAIKIIDWEYVCLGDPILDVTAIINNFKLVNEYETFFISSYRQHFHKSTKIDFSDKKLSDMKLLNQHIFQLWEYGQ